MEHGTFPPTYNPYRTSGRCSRDRIAGCADTGARRSRLHVPNDSLLIGDGLPFLERTGWWWFWALALLLLPAGLVVQAMVRFETESGSAAEPGMWLTTVPMMVGSLVPVAPCGLPLALG